MFEVSENPDSKHMLSGNSRVSLQQPACNWLINTEYPFDIPDSRSLQPP